VPIQKQIFRFQIAVDDVVRVEIIEGKRDLGGVEFRDWVRKALSQLDHGPRCLWKVTHLRLAQQTEKLTTFDEIHDHVEVLRVLERSPQSDQERMLDLL